MALKTSRIVSIAGTPHTCYSSLPCCYTLAFTGCILNSPGLQKTFLVSLQPQNNNSPATSSGVQIRVGYFGMCIRAGSAENCYISASTTSDVLLSRLQTIMNITGVDAEVAGLLPTALSLQGNISLPPLAAAGALFMLGLIFFALFNWTTKRATTTSTGSSTSKLETYKKILMTSLWSSVGLAIASAVSIIETSAALQFWTVDVPRSNILVSIGTGMQVLQWFVASLSVLFTLAVTSLISASEAGTLPGPGGMGMPQKPGMGVGRPPMPQMGGPPGGAPR